MPTTHRRTRASGRPGRRGDLSSAVVAGAVTLLIAVVAFGVTVTLLDEGRPPAAAQETAASVDPGLADDLTPNETVSALTILRDWDNARAKAWAAGNLRALRRLYVAGSSAGRHDERMLRTWLRRGLTVHGMRMQIDRIELRQRTQRRITFLVTDRLTGAVAVGHGRRTALPNDGDSTRLLRFVRRAGQWRLAAAYDRPASPDSTTDGTSGSANS